MNDYLNYFNYMTVAKPIYETINNSKMKSLIDLLNNDKISLLSFAPLDKLTKIYNDSHLFLLNTDKGFTYSQDEIVTMDTSLSLPFKTVCLSSPADKILCSVSNDETGKKQNISFLFINELSPNNYEFIINLMSRTDDNEFYKLLSHTKSKFNLNDEQTRSLYALYASKAFTYVSESAQSLFDYKSLVRSVNIILNHINKQEIGFVKEKRRIKYNINGTKQIKEIKHVVVCGSKREIEEIATNDFHRDVDWTHQWEVRGHWRSIDGIGKDRTGNYCIESFTWVKNHVKGNGVLIKKSRVFNQTITGV